MVRSRLGEATRRRVAFFISVVGRGVPHCAGHEWGGGGAVGTPRPTLGAFSFLQEFRKVLLPNSGERVCAVAPRLIGFGHYNGFAVFDAFDFVFENANIRRID